MPVGFPTKVNYATGDVLSAANMNDLSGTVNLLESAQYAAGKNPVLNSNFSVWQRGTSRALAASTSYTSGFTADRWQTATGANQATTISRQSTNDTTNLPNIQYCLRFQRNSGQTGTTSYNNIQTFETINSIPFAGETVTLSFYARAGANYSAASGLLGTQLVSSTGTDQNPNAVWAGSVSVIGANTTLTTTWQRFTYTGTVATNAAQLYINFVFNPVGTAGANDYYEVTGVQLETSTVASAYSPNGATAQAELAACQRYYYRFQPTSAATNRFGYGFAVSASAGEVGFKFPVNMRTAPTALEQSGTAGDYGLKSGATNVTFTSVPSFNTADVTEGWIGTVTSGTLVAGNSVCMRNTSTNAFLGWSAEL
jgi:hypothetical protein